MNRLRFRTKFLLSLLLISAALTCVTLLIVRSRLRRQVRQEIFEALRNSVVTFQSFQRAHEETLERSAELLANLPNLKALMTTRDAPTIQDASHDLWRLAGSDLFVLANRTGKVVALHASTQGITPTAAEELLQRTLRRDEPRDWWFGRGHLYEVFIQPIYFGAPAENSLLGILAVGYEIDERVAQDVSRIASSHVAFLYGNTIVVSTLPPSRQAELRGQHEYLTGLAALDPVDLSLGDERFLATSVQLAPGAASSVRLSVLKSYDRATAFMRSLNRLLLGVGLAAILVGSGLAFLISHTFTRPLANLVAGALALEKGDFGYSLEARGDDEVAHLTRAFDQMRRSLARTQEQLLHSERLATVGRMASSISHDLRHPLTAIVANAEFLSENSLDEQQRKDLYQEVRLAVNQMTDLIGSLLEFSRDRETLRPVHGRVDETIERAMQTVRARPEFRQVNITLACEGSSEGWFDPRKLERVFDNLLLNACEAVPPDSGKVEVSVRRAPEGLDIRVSDNGPGVPEPIRDKLFDPFVSHGKTNGIGLGLAVVQKIVQDHGGAVSLENCPSRGAVFRVTLPDALPAALRSDA